VISSFLRIVPMLAVPLSIAAAQHQHTDHASAAARDSLSAMATALSTTVSPALAGRARTELQLTQPMLALRGARLAGALHYAVMLNAERWTMPNGEPVPGIWGEGFVERRHPHTVLHELMLSGALQRGAFRASVAGGRGFVPFGTDDPMVRPFTKYPANHHLSQVMERIQLVAAIRVREMAAIELATFNGDEPLGPASAPQWNRFGDSHAARVTIWPHDALEIQASAASVRSPEFVRPDGLDQAKFSASARITPPRGLMQYALLEWAQTDEQYGGRHIVTYGSGLAEAMARIGPWSMAVRAEQTTRPEDERLLDPFRTARPPNHLVILGMTRWRILSTQLARSMHDAKGVHATLFGELSHAHSTALLRPVLLDPRDIIGANDAWCITAGLRVGVGRMATRAGRYGAGAGVAGTSAELSMRHAH
jgi:hypothetical protein